MLPAGTAMVVIAASGLTCPYATRPGSESAAYVLETNVSEDPHSPDSASGASHLIGGVLYENAMPDSDASGDLPTAIKTDLEARGFKFERLTDTRATGGGYS